MMQKFLFFSLLTGIIVAGCDSGNDQWEVVSPDGRISLNVHLTDTGILEYSVWLSGSVVMEHSPLGIIREDADLSRHLSVVDASPVKVIDETYRLQSGKQLSCRNHAREIKLSFENRSGERLDLQLRAYNDGVAFRYMFPGDPGNSVVVTAERTGFRLPEEGKAWMHPYDRVSGTSPAYETYYQGPMAVGTPASRELNGWAFPLLFQTDRAWILISESDVDANYCGVHLAKNPEGGLHRVELPVEEEALGRCPREPVVELPAQLPWRFIIVSDRLGPVVESNMVTHLAKPCQLKDTSWISHGKASWSWWSEELGARDYGILQKYVDLAADMGWKYSLVDAGWPEMDGGSIEQLVDYAGGKGIELLVWYNSGGRRHTPEQARQNPMYVPEKRRREFRRIHDMGISGIKVDFFNSDKQCIIDQYMGILRDAADQQLVVNFHGCTLPRGWRRTWPNLMTMEAIKGQEAYRYNGSYPEESPAHQVISVFTRNVVGPMDFTPVGISDRQYPHLTSYGFELAQAVVYESGITHICDSPEAYALLPGFAAEYLMEVPAAWDETRLVDGYPGDFALLARRKGEHWYVGCINGKNEPREITFGFPFLEKAASLEMITDGKDPESLERREVEIQADTEMTVKLLPFGGFVAIIR